jgi:hypothetical protein
MKSIQYTIWVLLALLVAAALDPQPDPPAVNPSTTLCKVLQHDYSCDNAVRRRDSLAPSSPCPVSLVAAAACKPDCPSDRMIFTVQAADPSPPSPTPTFQA